jgi:hypothetical protein
MLDKAGRSVVAWLERKLARRSALGPLHPGSSHRIHQAGSWPTAKANRNDLRAALRLLATRSVDRDALVVVDELIE